MKLSITIDLASYFNAERRVIAGEEGIFIPFRTNRSIIRDGIRATALFHAYEMKYPDSEGNTMAVFPFVPKKIADKLSRADLVKMTPEIGRIYVSGARTQDSPPPPPPPPLSPFPQTDVRPDRIGHATLAPRPVTDDEIPL